MKKNSFFLATTLVLLFLGCNYTSKSNEEEHRNIVAAPESTNFWGHGICSFVSENLPNGYKVAIFYKEKDNLCIWHLQRGDSIDRYVAAHKLPHALICHHADIYYPDEYEEKNETLDTTIIRDIEIPVVQQLDMNTLDGEVFFMDVNFDGEEDFIVAHSGYNRIYYACFDLVNGNRSNVCPGFLTSMDGEVYGNLVGGSCGKTEFDHKKKIIHITEKIGCCTKVETWAKPGLGVFGEAKVFKKIKSELWANGEEHIITYQLVNDTLKQISHEIIK